LVRDTYSSYRDYPLSLFQIQTKFRDERRPRAGLLRGREFLMKDSYSFDLDDAGLAASYAAHRAAYQRIFDRIGLRYTIVAAMSGAMGGSASEEFLAEAAVGEDTYVSCPACGYAANTEAVITPAPAAPVVEWPPAEVLDTPDTPTIESLVDRVNAMAAGGRRDWTAADTLKNVVVKLRPPGAATDQILVIGVPGDREVDLKRLNAVVAPATVELFEAADFAGHPDLVRGYIGPQVLAKLGIRYLVDPRVVPGTAWVTGANEPDRHAVHVVCGRDFTPDGTIEAAEVRVGDACPQCTTGALVMKRGIEIGHVFQLGRRYAEALGLTALGADGTPITITMGSYGIGLSRMVATIAEQYADERGLVWPAAVAPVDVHVVATGTGSQIETALRIGDSLVARGLRVLVDDREGTSAGVKFTDAELIGIPRAVVVGRRLVDGYLELRDRAAGTRADVSLDEIVDEVCSGL